MNFILFLMLFTIACSSKEKPIGQEAVPIKIKTEKAEKEISTAAERTELYLSKIKNKNIALVVNQTSMIGETHLVDSLLKLNIPIKKIFAPEHGFRGNADAGEQIKDGIDIKTNLPLVSLYGKKKKPDANDLKELELIIFDIQDVGARFYTYISSMSYLMESCAENNIPFMILDRPNPNGHYVSGPVLKKGYESFVGLHPIPVVHGMTMGEYAQMVNGEGWLKNKIKCELEIIKCKNYDHHSFYELPVKPSPNLPNMRSIYLYPSICFFEGTDISLGRGTDKQFQVLGASGQSFGNYEFTPVPKPGAKHPKHENKKCNGYDLTTINMVDIKNRKNLDLGYLIDVYQKYEPKEKFFLKNNFFDKLAGSDELQKQLIAGLTEKEIRMSWKEDLEAFKKIRRQYLLYKDFE